MAKNINVLLAIKDQFTAPLKKATKSTKDMQRQLDKARNKVKAFTNSIKNSMKTVAKWGAIGLGALTAATGLFIKQSLDAAKDKLKADKMLEATMKRNNIFSEERMQALKSEASALQDLGVVGDDVTLAGAGQLAMYKLNYEQIKKTMPILSDMVAKEKGLNGTQEDAIAMADVIGKAMNGQVKGLQNFGVSLTEAEKKLFKTMKAEQKLDFIVNKVNKSIGGTAKALRETDEGKISSMKGAWGDMQAELGKKLMPYLGQLAEWFHGKIPQIQDLILGTADKVAELIQKAQPYIEQFKNLIGSIWEKAGPALQEFGNILLNGAETAIGIAQSIIENWDRLSPIFYTVVGALAAYKTVVLIQAAATTIAAAAMKRKLVWDNLQLLMTGNLTLAQFKLNTAMSLNPIGILIAGIAALVGVGWLLYKNWDLVKNKVSELWKKLDDNPLGKLFKWFLRISFPIILLIENFQLIKEKVLNFWGVLKEKFIPILEAISNPIDTAKKAIGGLIDKLKFWDKTDPKDKSINISETTTSTTSKNPVVSKPGRKALGTSYFKGGTTGINEGGRSETAILPSGTKILSHEESKKISNNNDKKVEIHIHLSGNFIGEKEHMERYAEYTGKKVIAAINNM